MMEGAAMQSMNQDRSNVNIKGRYRILLVLWFAMLASVGLFFALTLLIPRQAAAENKMLSIILGAFGGFLAVFSLVPKQKMLQQAAEKQQPRLVNTAYILALALSETAGLFGLMMYILTPGRSYYVLFILAAAFMLVHFPRREHLLAASFKNQ
jgi:hypothetical protein